MCQRQNQVFKISGNHELEPGALWCHRLRHHPPGAPAVCPRLLASLPDPAGPWHLPATPTCGTQLPCGPDPTSQMDSLKCSGRSLPAGTDLPSQFQPRARNAVRGSSLRPAASTQATWQPRCCPPSCSSSTPPTTQLHPFAKEKSSLFNYVYVCFQNHDHRT